MARKLKKTLRIIIPIAVVMSVLFIFCAFWIIWGNTALQVTEYKLTYSDLPSGFNGLRIAHVSDLHDAEIGKGNERLLLAIKEFKPDIIVMTGDMIDSRRLDIGGVIQFMREAVKIAPCYYVTGNHESRISEYEEFREKIVETGVTVLENESVELTAEDDTITLIGIDDPLFCNSISEREAATRKHLETAVPSDADFAVLLAHRPEVLDVYAEYGMDLVLSGHVHGGQFRIPFIGGVYVPNQGLFPEYDGGFYTEENTKMIISRGIGNSAFPFRVNNRPELVTVVLTKSDN